MKCKTLLFGMLFSIPILAHNPYFLVFDIHSKNSQYNEKLKGKVYVMQQKNNNIKIVDTYPVMYGLNGAGKEREGDNKTPTGIYLIRALKNKGKRGWRKFGGYSIHLNYPNWYDQKAKRTGNYIAIHGGRVSATNGCPRVLDGTIEKPKFGSKNIAKIAKIVQQWETPIILVENCPNSLIEVVKTGLSKRASTFWHKIIKQQPSRATLKAMLLNYEANLKLKASSVYADKPAYNQWNLIDGISHTAWVLKPTDRKKEIIYEFNDTVQINQLKIKIGYDKMTKKYDRWEENSRPSSIRIHFDNGKSFKFLLKDTRDFQVISCNAGKTKSIRVEILKVFSGSKYPNDICISEMSFFR